jgi:hypothetical protein
MGQTTARSLLLIKTFLKEKYPGVDYSKVLSRLSDADQRSAKSLTEEQWAPYDLFFNILNAGAAEAACEVQQFCQEFGAFQVKHDTEYIYKMAIKFGGPGLMVMEANQIWKRYHDTGRFYVFDILAKSAKARIENIEGGGPMLCSVVLGFIRAGLELSGAKDVSVEHNRCRGRGDALCEYITRWS